MSITITCNEGIVRRAFCTSCSTGSVAWPGSSTTTRVSVPAACCIRLLKSAAAETLRIPALLRSNLVITSRNRRFRETTKTSTDDVESDIGNVSERQADPSLRDFRAKSELTDVPWSGALAKGLLFQRSQPSINRLCGQDIRPPGLVS